MYLFENIGFILVFFGFSPRGRSRGEGGRGGGGVG